MTYSEKLNILVKNTIEYYSTCQEVTAYKKYYDNFDYYNNLYKNKVDLFFTENNINQSDFYEGLNKIYNIPMLEKLKDNTHNIILNFAKYWITEESLNKRLENQYAGVNILDTEKLNYIRIWLFNNDYNSNMLTLEEQNNLMTNYIHFNAGMKKIKTVN
jgi:hypothetical protein